MEMLLACSPLTARLLANHLEFLRTHRGEVASMDGAVAVRSEKTEFTFLYLGREGVPESTLEAWRCVYRLPWSTVDAHTLGRLGFLKQFSLAYMTRPAAIAADAAPCPGTIEAVTTAASMEIFTDVQCQGFLETEDARAQWRPFLRAANFANLGRSTQSFYVASDADRPVSVTLALRTATTVGLYAVATLPYARGRGFSTQAMNHAIADAQRNHGCDLVTLQVAADSDVERHYARMGFHREFVVDVFGR